MVWSALPLTNILLSEVIAREYTPPECPSNVLIIFPVPGCQILIVLSSLPLAKI